MKSIFFLYNLFFKDGPLMNHTDPLPPPPGGAPPQFDDLPPPPRPEEMPKGNVTVYIYNCQQTARLGGEQTDWV